MPAEASDPATLALERFRKHLSYTRTFSTSPFRGHFGLAPEALVAFLDYVKLDRQHLFPELLQLDVATDAFKIPQLMSPSVLKVFMVFNVDVAETADSVGALLNNMVQSFPDLEKVGIVGGGVVMEYDDLFVSFFNSLPLLRSISLPRYALSPIIFHGLSDQPYLKKIRANDLDKAPEESVIGLRHGVQRWTASRLRLLDHGFKNLSRLSISLPRMRNVLDFIRQDTFPGVRLKRFELYVSNPRDTTPDQVIEFLEHLRGMCIDLEDLTLSMYAEASAPQDVVGIQPLGLSVLRAIATLDSLEHFRVEHTLPMALSDEDILEVAPELGHLETLSLTCHPLVLYKPTLSMLSVAYLARFCWGLSHLGLYLDGRRCPFVGDVRERTYPCFASLPFVLDVGLSPTPMDPSPEALCVLAEYLAYLLPLGSAVQTGYRELMFDSIEFDPVDGVAMGFAPTADPDMERYHKTWEVVDLIAAAIRQQRERSMGDGDDDDLDERDVGASS